jgi:hypothetical protein
LILPTGAIVAVTDSETVHLFRNTGVKLVMHLVEITAAPPAPAHAGSSSRHHTGSAYPEGRRLVEDDLAAATAAFLNKLSLDGTLEHLFVVSAWGDAQTLPPRPESQAHRRAREALQPASARGHRLTDRRHLMRLWKRLPALARPTTTTALDHPNEKSPGSLFGGGGRSMRFRCANSISIFLPSRRDVT